MPIRLPTTTPQLLGSRVELRAPTPEDIEGRRRLGKDPAIIRAFGGSPAFTRPQPMTAAEAEAWYRHHAHRDGPLHWFIDYDGRFIGTVSLTLESATDRRARFGIGILDSALLGHGLGTDTTRIVLDYGFADVGFHRISLRVLATNARAIRCYRRCGFVEEGREREAALIDGHWYDDVMMAVLAHEHSPT
jgi:ribosomal-protein-alanine N-acetyltransferase